jgi:hypothetical protein
MFDATKQISEEAKRFIVTAAKIPVGGGNYAVAVNYIGNKVPPIDRANQISLREILKPGRKPEILCPLELMLRTKDSPECLNFASMSAEEMELSTQADRIRMIWGFEHSTGEDKAKFKLALERFAMPIDEL